MASNTGSLGDVAKLQVFEDSRDVKLNTKVSFSRSLLEAELGPGLLTTIFDGLQNRLPKLAEKAGYFLPRGIYIPPIDREKLWEYEPIAKIGDQFIAPGDLSVEVVRQAGRREEQQSERLVIANL